MTSIRRTKSASGLCAAKSMKHLALFASILVASSSVAAISHADVCNPSGQTNCATNSCFFWVTGTMPSERNSGTNEARIGGSHVANLVGPGDYPDAAGDMTTPGPFLTAGMGSFDGIAIGSNTRVIIYDGPNFTGNVLLDQHGPRVLNNCLFYGTMTTVRDGRTCNDLISMDWSGQGSLFTQFTPATRQARSDMHGWGGATLSLNPWSPNSDGDAGVPKNSVRVICDPLPSSESCLPVGSCPPSTSPPPPTTVAAVNGACGGAGACSAGSVSSDNGQTACGTTRSWNCDGSGGGSTANCSVANAACPPSVTPVACSAPVMVNGACSTTPGNCTSGSSSSDNAASACYTTRTWDCVGNNGGSTANCTHANPLCTCVEGNIRLTMPGKVVSDIDGAATWTTSFGAGITHDGEPCEARASVNANGDSQVIIAAGTFAAGSTFCTATTTATVGGVSTTVEVEVSYNTANGDVHGIATVSPVCSASPPPNSCATPWGTTVVDGGSVVAFQNATEACGGSCTMETRVCNNGTLTGSYTNQNCSVASCPPPPPCTGPVTWTEGGFTCTADGGTVPISSNVSVRDRVYGAPPDGQGVAQFGCDATGNWVYQGGTCLGGQTCTPPVPEICP